MGESSAPRRPTHDTNTSRREVKREANTHTHTTTTTPDQSKHKHTMKITGLIASTLMLLVFVMASTASALSIEKLPTCLLMTRFGDAIRVDGELMHGDIRDNKCCWYGELVHESQCYQNTPIEPTPKPCCRANTLECQACIADVSEEEFCRRSLTHMSALRRSNAAELTLWSAKLVSQMSPRKSSAEGSLTHMSALRSPPNHLILITATPRI